MNAQTPLKAPFPYFGGKSKVAPLVWRRFGAVKNYVEPFFGSGAVLLGRPDFDPSAPPLETVNDKDGFVANFWRAVSMDPEAVANWCDWPVNECDLEARHAWLVKRRERLRWSLEDPDFYDAKIAGWWVWGLCSWIGTGWCAGNGPHQHDGAHFGGDIGQGINRQLPHLGDIGQGINRPFADGRGQHVLSLAERLNRVRVACGDWQRVCGPSVTERHGLTAVFLDPPYAVADRSDCYAEESYTVAHDVRAWANERGDNPLYRICVAGYEGEHDFPDTWETVAWKAPGGYANQSDKQRRVNKHRERLWFSPHCLRPAEDQLGTLL